MRPRPSWCRCKRTVVCEGHRDAIASTRLWPGIDAAPSANPFLPADDGDVVVFAGAQPVEAGADAGYDYTRGRWMRGAARPRRGQDES